jgi:hypothetical protein
MNNRRLDCVHEPHGVTKDPNREATLLEPSGHLVLGGKMHSMALNASIRIETRLQGFNLGAQRVQLTLRVEERMLNGGKEGFTSIFGIWG